MSSSAISTLTLHLDDDQEVQDSDSPSSSMSRMRYARSAAAGLDTPEQEDIMPRSYSTAAVNTPLRSVSIPCGSSKANISESQKMSSRSSKSRKRERVTSPLLRKVMQTTKMTELDDLITM